MEDLVAYVKKHTNSDIFEIRDEIDAKKLMLEMSQIGSFKMTTNSGKPKGDLFQVFVYSPEGNIPHVHVWDDSTKGKHFYSCVKLDAPEYFLHGNKNDMFSSKELMAFIKFMKDTKGNPGNYNNWQMSCYEWNKNNPTKKQIENLDASKMPDYTKLK